MTTERQKLGREMVKEGSKFDFSIFTMSILNFSRWKFFIFPLYNSRRIIPLLEYLTIGKNTKIEGNGPFLD
jgi:hypothetical protein